MPRRVMHSDLVVAEVDGRRVIKEVGRRLRADLETEHRPLFHDMLIQRLVVAMEIDGRVERVLRGVDAADVIEMRVGEQDVLDHDVAVADSREDLVDLVAGIDDDRLPGALAADDEPVLVERRDRSDFEDHSLTIVVDGALRR